MQSILYAIAAILVIAALPYLITFWVMLHTVFRRVRVDDTTRDQMPDHLHTMFQGAIAELEPHGFKISGYHLVDYGTTKDEQKWGILLQHSSQQTYVGLTIRQPLSSTAPLLLTYSTFFDEGCLLITINNLHYGIYSPSPNEVPQHAPDSITPTEQWHLHQQKLEELSLVKAPSSLDPEAFIAALERHSQEGIERLVQRGEVRWVEPGETYRMTEWTTAKAVFLVATKSKRTTPGSQTSSSIAANKTLNSTPAIELEIDEFYRLRKQRQTNGSRWGKNWLLLGTLALFIASYSSIFDPQKLVVFVAVLLFHEGGHVLAMKWFGYRDTVMLFIPFLGALATARKENASLTEKVWISLAGPLPGLILGIGLGIAFAPSVDAANVPHITDWFADSNWLREASWMLIGLNLFNLLPLYPLDGGQVADLLLFSRNPYLGVVFKGIGVVLLALLGLGQPLLLMFAVLIAVTIPGSFRLAKLNSRLRQELPQAPNDEQAWVQCIFSKLQTSPYQTLPFAKKYVLAVGLLDSRQEEAAKWTTRLGLTGIYLVSLLTGIAGGLYALVPNWNLWITMANPTAYYQNQMQQEIADATQMLQANPRSVEAYLKRGRARMFLKDLDGAIADANQVLQIDPNSSQGYQLRGLIRRRRGDVAGADADQTKAQHLLMTQKIQQMNQALRKNPNDAQAYLQRASARHQLGQYPEAIADANQALRLNPKSVWGFVSRGTAYLELKDYPRAIADANQALRLQPNSGEAYYLRGQARRQAGDEAGAIADEQKAETLFQAEEDAELY